MTFDNKIITSGAKIEFISFSREISDIFFKNCFFCGKECEITTEQEALNKKFSDLDRFHCNFCLQHNLHNKSNRDVLIFSFKGIIGHFYFKNYLVEKNQLWVSQIEDYIDSHVKEGLSNPIFLYDPDSFLWFVNFSRVGNTRKKMSIKDVLKTVSNILSCFELSKNAPEEKEDVLYLKFKDAIESFYRKRYRPDNQKILTPTIIQDENYEKIKNFSIKDLEIS